jgi:hypothetical protein
MERSFLFGFVSYKANYIAWDRKQAAIGAETRCKAEEPQTPTIKDFETLVGAEVIQP